MISNCAYSPDAIIETDKLTDYLLVRRERNDKSGYLARAGFILDHWQQLEQAVRKLVASVDAVKDRVTQYGTFYP